MCLRIKKRFKTKKEAIVFTKKPLIAKTNMHVYKALDGNRSPHRRMAYEKGMHYYQQGKKFSFSIHDVGIYIPSWVVDINIGLHSCKTFSAANHHPGTVVKMVIPKGSKYFVGEDDDIVSDNLIWY